MSVVFTEGASLSNKRLVCFFPVLLPDNHVVNRDTDNELGKASVYGLGGKLRDMKQRVHHISLYMIPFLGKNSLKIAHVLGHELGN